MPPTIGSERLSLKFPGGYHENAFLILIRHIDHAKISPGWSLPQYMSRKIAARAVLSGMIQDEFNFGLGHAMPHNVGSPVSGST
jgi:hypothetical protein